ncbi:MAG: glycosyltransferase [Terriglobia bacterium]|jgi:glycosyltransferase involved in cell wall biosynthesis
MTFPLVSVVMSVFNGECFLREAVESILAQSLRDFEFIIIDDGSTDRSASMLDSYQNSDVRLKVYHREHGGLIESLNRGCALAQGKYIARMDADDVAIKDRLAWQIEFMDAHPEIGVVGGAVEWIDATGKSLAVRRYPSDDPQIKATLLQQGCAFWHPTVVLRREVFAWAGGYRRVVVDSEDYDLWLRIADHFQLANLEKVVLKYRIHPHQVSMRKTAQQTLGILAAQVAASARRSGLPDPLNSVAAITSESLAALGVTQPMLRKRFASYRRDWIRNMVTAGEYSAALEAALEILHSDLKYVDRGVIADLHLIVAKLLWEQKRFARSFVAIGYSVIAWPAVTVRLGEAILRRLRTA